MNTIGSEHKNRERQDAEAGERDERERWRVTLASIGDAVVTTDSQGRVAYLNAIAQSLTGWTDKEAEGQPLATVFRIINEQTRQPVENPVGKVLRGGGIVGLANHTVLIAKDGSERPIDDSAAPIRCKEGKIVGCVLVFRDVTDRRRAERFLQESEARKTAMFEAALDCIISINHEGTITEFNAAAESTFGHRREDVLGRELAALLIPPAFRERHRKGLVHYLTTGEGQVLNQRLELSALRADGTEFPVELTVTRIPVDGPPLFTAYLRDITERKRAEDALRQRTAQFETLLNAAPLGVYLVDGAFRIRQVNPTARPVFGDIPDLIGQDFDEVIRILWPKPDADEVVERFRHTLETGEPYIVPEWTEERLDRGVREFYEWQINRISLPEGGYGVVCYFRDISAQVQARQAIAESEQRFRGMADAIPQLAWTAHADGFIHWYNRRWYEYTGTTPQDMEGWGWQSVHDPKTLPKVLEQWKASITTGEPFEMVFPLRGTDGRFRSFLTRVQPLKDVQGRVVQWFGTNTDVEELKRTEEALHESERRLAERTAEAEQRARELARSNAALEELGAVVAHDLRQPLRTMKSYIQKLAEHYLNQLDEQAHDFIVRTARAADQMRVLIDDLLAYSRAGAEDKELAPTDCGEVLAAALANLQAAIDESDATVTAGDLPTVRGDPTQLLQLFQNLIGNAVKFRGDEPPRVHVQATPQGSFWLFEVTDNGIGIESEYLNRIFKLGNRLHSVAKYPGNGIGLATCEKIVQRHGGRIWVSSPGPGLGLGSTFAFTLPTLRPDRVSTEPDA